jgi:hypothetical protein
MELTDPTAYDEQEEDTLEGILSLSFFGFIKSASE